MSNLLTSKILGERHCTDIIIFLHMFGPRSRTEIYNSISTGSGMARKLNNLEEKGIVRSVPMENSKRVLLYLTPLGVSYANALEQLEQKSGGDLDRYRIDTVRGMMPPYSRNVE